MPNFSNPKSVILVLNSFGVRFFLSLVFKSIASQRDPKWQFQGNVILVEHAHCSVCLRCMYYSQKPV